MDERDMLYHAFQQANEERKRNNFNAFMDGLEGGLVKDLDSSYASGDMQKYNKLVANLKNKGMRIFRNSEGKHKVKFAL